MTAILTSICTVKKLRTKTSVFNKNAQKLHIKLVSREKDTASILTKSKIDSVHFVENL